MNISEKVTNLLLATMPNAKLVAGKRELLTRCMYCGDSRNPKSGHFYIGIEEGKVFPYYCQRCNASGIIDHKKLMEWGLYDQDVNVQLIEYNKVMFSKKENFKFLDNFVYKLSNRFISDNELSKVKLDYINNRLGSNLTHDDLMRYKIVLNLYDLLNSNYIKELSRDPRIVEELNRSFLGFISQDNAFINMRNLRRGKVHPGIDKKYVNYNIFNKYENTQRFYTIPTSIDLTIPKRIKLNISEGPFDILSVFLNLRKKEDHSIYSAIVGSGYMNVLRHFIINMKLIYSEVHIYIDNDTKDHIIPEIVEFIRPYQIPLYVHRNDFPGEKDFGVKINKIDERMERLL